MFSEHDRLLWRCHGEADVCVLGILEWCRTAGWELVAKERREEKGMSQLVVLICGTGDSSSGYVGWLLAVRGGPSASAPDAAGDDDAKSHVAGLSAFAARGASSRACLPICAAGSDSSVVFVGSRRIAFRTAITQTQPVRDIITRQRPKHLDSYSASLMQYSDGSLRYFQLWKTFNQASPSRSETISSFSLCRCAKKTFPDSHLLICNLPSLISDISCHRCK